MRVQAFLTEAYMEHHPTGGSSPNEPNPAPEVVELIKNRVLDELRRTFLAMRPVGGSDGGSDGGPDGGSHTKPDGYGGTYTKPDDGPGSHTKPDGYGGSYTKPDPKP